MLPEAGRLWGPRGMWGPDGACHVFPAQALWPGGPGPTCSLLPAVAAAAPAA